MSEKTILSATVPFTYEVTGDVLLASWDDNLRAESEVFYESVKQLFQFAVKHNLKKVFIDSGKPSGGVLTEEIMLLVQQSIVKADPQKIALLESCDFHWDNNLLQFLQYLQAFLQLYFQVKLFTSKREALDWLFENKI